VEALAKQWGGGWKIPVNSGFTNKKTDTTLKKKKE